MVLGRGTVMIGGRYTAVAVLLPFMVRVQTAPEPPSQPLHTGEVEPSGAVAGAVSVTTALSL